MLVFPWQYCKIIFKCCSIVVQGEWWWWSMSVYAYFVSISNNVYLSKYMYVCVSEWMDRCCTHLIVCVWVGTCLRLSGDWLNMSVCLSDWWWIDRIIDLYVLHLNDTLLQLTTKIYLFYVQCGWEVMLQDK